MLIDAAIGINPTTLPTHQPTARYPGDSNSRIDQKRPYNANGTISGLAGFGRTFSAAYRLTGLQAYRIQQYIFKQWVAPMNTASLYVTNPRSPAILLSTSN
jgi:hypothetical protein